MKAAIYNPYWDTLGGGERYTATFVEFLIEKGYKVDIQWHDKNLVKDIKRRFSIDITDVRIVDNVNRGDGYDLCFWLSDGSIPTLKSRKNVLHFQFPFQNTDTNSLLNRMKFFRIKYVVCNSEFTKKFIDKEYSISSTVIYPPVDTSSFRPKRKENKILYVGRFSQLTQSKNQHILIEVFKKLYDQGNKSWKLILAGGAEVGAGEYIEELKNSAKSYPISIKTNLSFNEMKDLYGTSKIFWSAAGYGVDEEKSPIKLEHFGITVVEAMASKCLPIVTNLGGYKEIIKDYENGIFWNKKSDLLKVTSEIIKDKTMYTKLAKQAQIDSSKFDEKAFKENFDKLLK